MSGPARWRRLWLGMGLAAGLLAAGGLLARRFRPLNETERILVGAWRHGPMGSVLFRFEADRTFRSGWLERDNRPRSEGSWSASPGRLELGEDVDIGDMIGHSWSLRIDGPDRISLAGDEFVRASDPAGR